MTLPDEKIILFERSTNIIAFLAHVFNLEMNEYYIGESSTRESRKHCVQCGKQIPPGPTGRRCRNCRGLPNLEMKP